MSADRVITSDDLYTGWRCDVPINLAQGASYTCQGPVDWPAGVAAGTWHFGGIADQAGVIAEADEVQLEVCIAQGLKLVG